MTTGHRSDPDGLSDPQALRREIADTRDALAETLSALLYKMDVKARARDRIVGKAAGTRDKVHSALSHRPGAHRRTTMDLQHPHESWHGIEAVQPSSRAVVLSLLAVGLGAAIAVAALVHRRRCG